jgi:hypothetical protein
MLRHALASAMTANKEPASIIAAQLRHADGGGLAQRVYIHQLPQTAPRVAGLIEGVFGPAARNRPAVSAGRQVEGNRSEIHGFTDAFTVFTVAAAVAAVLSLRLVPSGTPQMTGAPHAH